MPISPQDRTTSGRTAGSSAGSGMSFVTTPTASAGTIGLAMFNTSPSLQTVPNGTAGYILVSSGPTTAPVWQPPTAVFTDDQTFASSPAGNVTMVFTPLPPSGTDGTINYTVVADVVRPVTTSGSYNNTISGLVADNIQEAIDEVATLIAASALEIQDEGTSIESSAIKMDFTGNLVDVTSFVAGEVIINIDSNTPGSYDNITSGLAADNVQEAIDEVEGRLDIAETNITNLLAESHPAATVSATSNPALTIDTPTQVANLDLTTAGSYDNTTSGLIANNVQGAIDEINAKASIKKWDGSPTGATLDPINDLVLVDADNGLGKGGDGAVELGGVLHKDTDIDTAGFNTTLSGTGKLGLGSNTTPNADIHINKASTGAVEILAENTATTSSDYADIVALNGDVRTVYGAYKAGGYGYTGTESNHDLFIQANNTTAIVVKTNGQVGIGAGMTQANISDALYVNTGTAGDSGITVAQLTNATAPTAGAGAVGVDANGKLVRVASATPIPTTAVNGASINAGNVVLGQDVGQAGNPAQFTSNREIPTNGFNLNFNTASATDTQIKDNGDVIVGGESLQVVGNHTGEVVQLQVGVNNSEVNNTSVIQQATRGTSGTDGVVRNEILVSSGNPLGSSVSEFNEVGYLKSAGTNVGSGTVRGWKFNLTNSIKNLIAASATGEFFLSESGWRNGTALPAELPVTSTSSTLENLAIDTSNGQVVRGGELAGKVYRYSSYPAGFCQTVNFNSGGAGTPCGVPTQYVQLPTSPIIALNNIPAPLSEAPFGYKWVADVMATPQFAGGNATGNGLIQQDLRVNGTYIGGISDNIIYAPGYNYANHYFSGISIIGADINQTTSTPVSFNIQKINLTNSTADHGLLSFRGIEYTYAIRLAKI